MSKTKIAIAVAIALIVLIIAGVLLTRAFRRTNDENITLTMWGVFDDPALYESSIRAYEQLHPNVNIQYQKVSEFNEYEDTLINAFASTAGPDIWLMHHTWLPKYIDKLVPMPLSTKDSDEPPILFKDFESQFVDIVVQDLTVNQRLYGAPLYVDTLALYYNKDMFNDAGITVPPQTWEEFNNAVRILTQKNEDGRLNRSAAAIGTARNINRSVDILSMLMIQSGVRMVNAERTSATFANSVQGVNVGEVALQYYTDFADRSNEDLYTWDEQSAYSIDAFVQGQTAMMFNYSHHIPTIRSRAARFNFGVAPVPQLSTASIDVTYANYWVPVVSEQSLHQEQAWDFLVYLMSPQGSAPYISASGRPAARKSFIDEQRTDRDLGVFATQALSARSWFQADNREIEIIFADMIDDVNFGRRTIRDALKTAQNKVNVLMTK